MNGNARTRRLTGLLLGSALAFGFVSEPQSANALFVGPSGTSLISLRETHSQLRTLIEGLRAGKLANAVGTVVVDGTVRSSFGNLVATALRLMRASAPLLGKVRFLSKGEKAHLKGLFPARILSTVQVVEEDARKHTDSLLNKLLALFKSKKRAELAGAGPTAMTVGADLVFLLKPQGEKSRLSTLKHELVHACQYDAMGSVDSFAREYTKQIFDGYVKSKDMDAAYTDARFEREAYDFEADGKGPVFNTLPYCKETKLKDVKSLAELGALVKNLGKRIRAKVGGVIRGALGKVVQGLKNLKHRLESYGKCVGQHVVPKAVEAARVLWGEEGGAAAWFVRDLPAEVMALPPAERRKLTESEFRSLLDEATKAAIPGAMGLTMEVMKWFSDRNKPEASRAFVDRFRLELDAQRAKTQQLYDMKMAQ